MEPPRLSSKMDRQVKDGRNVILTMKTSCSCSLIGHLHLSEHCHKTNDVAVHYKHEYVRACLGKRGEFPSSDTLGWPSDAARVRLPFFSRMHQFVHFYPITLLQIRDHYISVLSTVNREERRSPRDHKVTWNII